MKKTGFAAQLAIAIFGLSCLWPGSGMAQEKSVTLRYSNMFPPDHPLSTIAEEWSKEVEKRTRGAVQVKYYPASTLTSPVQTYESVIKGVVDVGNALMGYSKGRFPLMAGIWENPFEYPDGLTSTRICNAAYDRFKPREFDNVKVLYFNAGPEPVLFTVKKPLLRLDDLKGMRFRSMDANARILSSFSVSAIGMPAGEVYDALSKGMMDGVTSVYSNLKAFKTADILKYALELRGTAFIGAFVVAMNKDKWDGIAPASRKIIEEVNREWIDRHGKVHDAVEQEGKTYALSRGMTVSRISAEEQARWNSRARPLYDEYIASTKQKNLPGEEMIRFVREKLKESRR